MTTAPTPCALRRTPRPVLTRGLAPLAALALLLGLAPPALAEPAVPPEGSAPVTTDADPAAGRLHAASSDPAEPGLDIGDAAGERVLLDRKVRPVAPGMDLTSFDWVAETGFIRGQVLSIELGDERVAADYLSGPTVTERTPLPEQAEQRRAVAAINGDFFDINNTDAPLGVGLSAEQGLVKGPVPGHDLSVGFDAEGLGHVTRALFSGQITLPDGSTVELDGWNQHRVDEDGIGAFTELWGEGRRSRLTEGATTTREVTVVDGVVTAVADQPGADPVPAGAMVLLGRDAGAAALAGLAVGEEVAVEHDLRFEGAELEAALGGNVALVLDGRPVEHTDRAAHPRTAIGFDATGSRAFVVSIDGRIAESRGMTYRELGDFMVELGAHTALNLDGGGSSTMLAREAGETELDVENTPSDGELRPVPNGLGFFAAPGSGRLTDLRVTAADDPDDESLLRVFPGLSRPLQALGHDETWAPAPSNARWRTSDVTTVRVRDGVVTGREPGTAEVTAFDRRVSGSVEVQVLQELERIRPSTDGVTLLDADDVGEFDVVGSDRLGFETTIDPDDVTLDYDTTALSITADGAGFDVEPLTEDAAEVVTITVAEETTHLGVSVGVEEQVLADFDDGIEGWRFGTARGAGSISPATGEDGSGALRMEYDFTRSTATRTAYAFAPTPLQVEGTPLSVGIDVLASGEGEWTAFTVIDSQGVSRALYGPYLTEPGWQRIEVDVPQTLSLPVSISRVYTIETKANRSYSAEVTFDNLTVSTAPSVDVPAPERVTDDVVVTQGDVDGAPLRVAVVSDAQFTAQDQSLVPATRRTLREAVAAEPDFVVINGDLIDTAFPADLALARRVIEEELEGKVPWYYLPGNHEIYGVDGIAAFEAEFGPAQHSFVHEGTRFVMLDSSTGTLRGGGFDQWQLLDEALRESAADDTVSGVVALWHHPPRDPSPLALSQLNDRYEAAVVERLLAEFRAETGKGAAFVGAHTGAFSASSVDGVPYVINGNMAKAPSGSPADGGFAGWTMIGVDPDGSPEAEAADERWFSAEIRATVDELSVSAPASMTVGGTAEAEATVTQERRSFPVAYPVSARWGGGGVHVGTGRAPRSAVVALDPATGELTALRPGTATLTVEVNDTVAETEVVVTR